MQRHRVHTEPGRRIADVLAGKTQVFREQPLGMGDIDQFLGYVDAEEGCVRVGFGQIGGRRPPTARRVHHPLGRGHAIFDELGKMHCGAVRLGPLPQVVVERDRVGLFVPLVKRLC